MNTNNAFTIYRIEAENIARHFNATIVHSSVGHGVTCVGLDNGLIFTISYRGGYDYGFIYIRFNNINYNYSMLEIRELMFEAMQNNLKGRNKNVNNGEDSGF